jgi:hypothetical protein
MKTLLLVIMISFVLVSGCKKDNTTTSDYTPSCTGAAKSYTKDVAPIIELACSGCHQNYSNYSQVSASQSSIRSVIVSGQMPQGSSLSSAQKDAIVCWIDSGAINN